MTAANRQVYLQGYHVSLPTTFAGRQFYRTTTDGEFFLMGPESGEVVLSIPLPMIALQVRGRYVASYAFQGAKISNPSKHWERKLAEFQEHYAQWQEQLPGVFELGPESKALNHSVQLSGSSSLRRPIKGSSGDAGAWW